MRRCLDRGWFKVVGFSVVILFGVILVDYLVLGEVGMRFVPLSYGAEEWALAVLGVLTAVVALLVYAVGRDRQRGLFLSSQVRFHRLILLFASIPLLLAASSFLGRFSWQLDLTSHYRVQLGAWLLVAALLLALAKAWRYALGIGVLVLAVSVSLLPHLLPRWSKPSAGGAKVRLALLNINSGNRSFDKVRNFLASSEADVLVIEEVTPKWMDQLDRIRQEWRYGVSKAQGGNFGIALFSRIPLDEATIIDLGKTRVPSVSTTFTLAGGKVRLIGAHLFPPRDSEYVAARTRQYRALAEIARESSVDVVILGDLNATPWSYEFRNLLSESGLQDSSRGWGLSYTWPAGIWALGIPVDHCLVSEGLEVIARTVGPHIGSDHYPLVVDVRRR